MTTTSFFFTETPDHYKAKEMYNTFREFRDIDEVILPPKRDKRGKHFGFARFFNFSDERMLTIKLDNIIIESRKIHVNLPKFNREHLGYSEKENEQQLKGRMRDHRGKRKSKISMIGGIWEVNATLGCKGVGKEIHMHKHLEVIRPIEQWLTNK